MSLTLLLGGTRSGKSARGERLARATGLPVRYVATGDASDPEMAARIERHRARRPAEWTTVDAGPELADCLPSAGGECVIVDGLGVWVASRLHRAGAFDGTERDATAAACERIAAAVDRFCRAAAGPDPVIVVAEDAGRGVLPPDRASRVWLDVLGEAVERIARSAERVELVVAGRSIVVAAEAPGAAEAAEAGAASGADVTALRRHGDTDVRPGDADHAVNVMSGGPPEWLRDALHEALDARGGAYPGETGAVAALAALHGREAEEVVPTNGAAEALWLLPAALRPSLAACVHPGFTEAEAALRAHGVAVARVHRDPERGFALDPAAVPDGADLVVLGNPASPSGTLDPAAAILALRRPGRTVVVDEAFMDLVPGQPASLAGEPLDDVIVVRSMTKSLAIPGLRAGYALAAPRLAHRLRAVRPPWSANAVALAALEAVAKRPDALAAAAERAAAEREDLFARLSRIDGVRTWPGAANFCLVEVPNAPDVVARLRERSIAVRPAASFPGLGRDHVRLTARSPAENARLAEALAEAVAGVRVAAGG